MNQISFDGNADDSSEGRAQTDEEIRNARYTPEVPWTSIYVFNGVIDGHNGGVLPGSVLTSDVNGIPLTAIVHLDARIPIQAFSVTNEGIAPQFRVL